MKKVKGFLRLFPLVVLSFVFLTACNQKPKDVTEQIKNANATFMEAFNMGDAHALAMSYTEDGKLLPGESEAVEGQEAIEAFWNGAIGMGITKADLETENAKAVGNMAIEVGKYRLFNNNGDMVDQGKYLVNWTKENGKWKLHQDIWNTSIPEPPVKGAWKLVEIKNIDNGAVAYHFPDGNVEMGQVKIWTNGHFSFNGTYKMNNESSDNYGGGTYALNGGNIYTENIEYHTSKPMIGTSVKMRIEVSGNTLTQIYPVDDSGNFDENNYSVEKYMRLD